MLGIGGRFVGAKGMVQMPNLANLSPTAATAALTAAGLQLGTASEVESSNSGDNEKVFTQSVAAGTLVDYDSAISYSYYRYVPPAIVYTLDTVKIADGSPTTETGCNKTPNLQNASNQYFYCTRTLTPYKYKLLANGVWDGVSYGGYFTEYSTWNCGITADQCGNNQTSVTEISRSSCIGPEGSTGYQNVTYRRNYAAGSPTNVTYTEQQYGCTVPVSRYEITRSTSRGSCSGSGIGGCYCGQRTVTTTIIYNTGPNDTITSTECCPPSTSTVTGDPYYAPCNNSTSTRSCSYRITTYDCAGAQISTEVKSCAAIPCGCSSTAGLVSCTSWSGIASSGTYAATRTCTYRRPDCTTYTVTETQCGGCTTWTSSGRCTSGRLSQTRTCYRADCSTYTESRTIAC